MSANNSSGTMLPSPMHWSITFPGAGSEAYDSRAMTIDSPVNGKAPMTFLCVGKDASLLRTRCKRR